MKKSIKISLVAAVGIMLLAQIGYSIGSSITEDQFGKEMKQFDDGINRIQSSSRTPQEKEILIKEANELRKLMEEIHQIEQKENSTTLQDAKKLAQLYLDGNIKAVRFSKLLGEPQNRNLENLENSTIGEPTLIPALNNKPERWSAPIIKNGILIGNIDIDKSTGRIGTLRY